MVGGPTGRNIEGASNREGGRGKLKNEGCPGVPPRHIGNVLEVPLSRMRPTSLPLKNKLSRQVEGPRGKRLAGEGKERSTKSNEAAQDISKRRPDRRGSRHVSKKPRPTN